jgi:GT2 family glycosyltransferase
MLSFVLLNWNSGAFLDECVRAVSQQDSRAFELIAVDNGSTNDSLARLRAMHADGQIHKLVELESNRGFAAGMNAGIEHATGDLIVPLNSDVCVASNFVSALHAVAADAPGTVGMWAVPEYVWRWTPTSSELSDDLFSVGVSLVRRISATQWHPAVDPPEHLFGPEGSAPVYRAAALHAARQAAGHVFDPSYGSYGEDIDLVLRLRSLGFACGLCLDTATWHIGSASAGGGLRFNSKPAALQAQAQRNRLRNYARIRGWTKVMTVLPWVLMDDLHHVLHARERGALLLALARAYGGGIARNERAQYGGELRFAGAVFSRSAKHRMREPLPSLGQDLSALRPRTS